MTTRPDNKMEPVSGVLAQYQASLLAKREARALSGITEDDGPPLPVIACADCQDHGSYTLDVHRTDPRFGQVLACHCQPDRRSERMARFTALTDGQRRMTFDVLGASKATGQADLADWNTVLAYAEVYARGGGPTPWMVFAGSVGWGKTHLALAILNHRIDNPDDGPAGKFVNCPDFLGIMRGSIDEGDFEETLEQYRTVPLLVLDELGGEYRRQGGGVSWAEEQIYRVVDYRYREKTPTVVTTNAPLDRVGARIRDRLRDTQLVTAFGLLLPSYRTGEVLT